MRVSGMRLVEQVPPRAIRVGAVLAAIVGMAMLAVAPAWAHVRVGADNPATGEHTMLTFSVPNESETGSPTTQLSVALPNLTSVSTESMPGWTVHLDRDLHAGTVSAITWTAAPGTGIGADQFGQFHVAVKLPDTPTVSFPATQTYGDGTVVRWNEPPLPGGGEPEHPAPTLTLAPGHSHERGAHGDHGAMPSVTVAPANAEPAPADVTARWLAGAALVVGAAAVALTLWARRRS